MSLFTIKRLIFNHILLCGYRVSFQIKPIRCEISYLTIYVTSEKSLYWITASVQSHFIF